MNDNNITITTNEGPEVLNIAERINFFLRGHTLKRLNIKGGRYSEVRPNYWDEFEAYLPSRLIKVHCRGNVIYLEFGKNAGKKDEKRWWYRTSLGETGSYNLLPSKAKSSDEHVVFIFRRWKLIFYDPTILGTVIVFPTRKDFENDFHLLAKPFIGTDIISKEEFLDKLDKYSNKTISSILVDQTKVCSGIGNYILSEALYRSKINPFNKISRINVQARCRLYYECSDISATSFSIGCDNLKIVGKKEDPNGCTVLTEKGPHAQLIWWVPAVQRAKNT